MNRPVGFIVSTESLFFGWYTIGGFCHRTDSDLFIILLIVLVIQSQIRYYTNITNNVDVS